MVRHGISEADEQVIWGALGEHAWARGLRDDRVLAHARAVALSRYRRGAALGPALNDGRRVLHRAARQQGVRPGPAYLDRRRRPLLARLGVGRDGPRPFSLFHPPA